jgi:hypothetical protein
LSWEQRQSTGIKNREKENPDIPDDVCTTEVDENAGGQHPLGPVTGADLVKGEANDEESEDCMEVVLRRATLGVLGLDPVDDPAESTLEQVQDEEDNTPSLVIVIEMKSASAGY